MVAIADIKITRAHRKTLSLHVLPNGTIEVKAPFLVPRYFINKFLEKNSEWIEKRTKLVAEKRALDKTYSEGETYLYLGETYTLTLADVSEIKIENDKLLFPKALTFRIKKEIQNWYIRQAKEVIMKETEKKAEEMDTSYNGITFSDTKSQWGRCTHDNRLQFSWRLIMTPLLVLRYVVVHELAHTKEKNHSFLFWAKVRSVNPSYKQQIKWLKTNGNNLIV